MYQKIIWNFLYHARKADEQILMTIKFLVEIKLKVIEKTAIIMTHLLNYCMINPKAETHYIQITTILYLYSKTSYLSETNAQIRSGGLFLLVSLKKTIQPEYLQTNVPVQV